MIQNKIQSAKMKKYLPGIIIFLLALGVVGYLLYLQYARIYCHGAMTADGTVATHCHTKAEYFGKDGTIHLH